MLCVVVVVRMVRVFYAPLNGAWIFSAGGRRRAVLVRLLRAALVRVVAALICGSGWLVVVTSAEGIARR